MNDPESSVTDADTDESNGNFEYTVDLVKFIRKEFDDYFTIAVAGKTSCTGDLNSFSPIKFINIHLLTISIQNQLFCCENIGIDHALQTIQYEKLNSPKLYKRKVWIPFRRI